MATQREVARHLDLSVAGLRRLQEAGAIPTAEKHDLDLEICRIAYIRWLRRGASGRGAQSSVREKLDAIRLEKAQYELAKLKGTMVRIEDVMPFFERRLTALHQHLLPIGGMVAAEIDPDDPARIQDIVDAAVAKAMEEMNTAEDPEYSDAELASPEVVAAAGIKKARR